MQLPPRQMRPARQSSPQVPQLFGSVVRFTQLEPQGSRSAGQSTLQSPDSHTGLPSPAGQTVPQPPQLSGSESVFTQLPEQSSNPD